MMRILFSHCCCLILLALPFSASLKAQDYHPLLRELIERDKDRQVLKQLEPDDKSLASSEDSPSPAELEKLKKEKEQLEDLRIINQYAPYAASNRSFPDDPWLYGHGTTGKLVADLFNALRQHHPDITATMDIQGDAELADILLSAPDRVALSMGHFAPIVHQAFERRYDVSLLEIPLGRPHKEDYSKTPYLIFKNDPMGFSSPTIRALVRYLYSREGQTLIYKAGIRPIPLEQAQKIAILYGVNVKPSQEYIQEQNQFHMPPGPPATTRPDARQIDYHDYKAVKPAPTGTIKSIGSDTLNNLITFWCEAFCFEIYPRIAADLGRRGSTAPPALIAGMSNFAPMSRKMKSKELEKFVEKFGYEPTPFAVASDVIAIFVHKDNPIAKRGLTLHEIDAIFSSTRKGGHTKDITTWGDLGMTGQWKDAPITLYGRNSASGTYGFFRKHALFKGSFKDTVKEQPGSSSVVFQVGKNIHGIGYSGSGYITKDVVAVPISHEAGQPFIHPEKHNAIPDYPLGRFLYLYVNVHPEKELDPLRREFLKYIYSKQGQSQVIKDGLLPISPAQAREELKKARIVID